MTSYLWQRAGLVLCPPLVGQQGQYWRAEGLMLIGAGKQYRTQYICYYKLEVLSYMRVCVRSYYLFGGCVWTPISCVVGCGPQVYFPGRDPTSLASCCCLCCLDYVYTLGGNSLFFIFELFSGLSIVRRTTPILLVVTVVKIKGQVRSLVL